MLNALWVALTDCPHCSIGVVLPKKVRSDSTGRIYQSRMHFGHKAWVRFESGLTFLERLRLATLQSNFRLNCWKREPFLFIAQSCSPIRSSLQSEKHLKDLITIGPENWNLLLSSSFQRLIEWFLQIIYSGLQIFGPDAWKIFDCLAAFVLEKRLRRLVVDLGYPNV